MVDFRAIKAEVRQDVLTRRDALSAFERERFSRQIKQHFSELDIDPAAVISAFLPIRSEADLNSLIEELWTVNHKVCLPFMLDRETIEFRQYGPQTVLIDNGFGTVAPQDGSDVIDPDIMLVPLSAFDQSGGRIGYGAGFYDRAIGRLLEDGKTPLLIGVAFSCQEVDQVPCEDHDIPLDMVLTENGLLISD